MERLFNGIAQLIGGLAVIAIVVTAFGLMLRILKPADAFKRIGVIVGVVTALSILPQIIIHAWTAIPLWQQILLIALGAIVVIAFSSNREKRHKRRA